MPPSNWEFVAYWDQAGNAQLLSHFLDNPWQAAWLNAPDRTYPITRKDSRPPLQPWN